MPPKTKIALNQIIVALLWIVALALLLSLHWWVLAAAIFGLHAVELVVTGYKRGIDAGYSRIETITLTLIYGYTWWLYLEKKNPA
jgi:hypothetical protein